MQTRHTFSGSINCVSNEAKPTVKQVYAIAAALCKESGREFPQSRGEASEMIKKLRGEPSNSAQG